MRSVVLLSTTPVKSTKLHHPDSVYLQECGVADDRQFYLLNERGNLFATGRYGPMLLVRADYDRKGEHLEFHFPDGRVLEGDARAGEEPVETDFFGRSVEGHFMSEMWNGPLGEQAGMPVRLVRCDQPGAASDVMPVTLMSSASVEELGRQGGLSETPDGRRFRMLIEIDGCEPHEEDGWNGHTARIGEATIRLDEQVPRCAATTLNPVTGERDLSTLKILNDYRADEPEKMPFGVYAEVVSSGSVSIGDVLELEG